ncbi:MAG: tRNA dihydrouridine(20/20a) synthase DusA [Candidatus Neomarinimicrobiota bacterium]
MNDLDNIQHKFCIAPMMDKTDRHCRYFHRLMSNRAFLYTEMLHSNAVIRGNKERLLKYNPREHPLAIQLGGCDPVQLGEASAISEEFGYTEVNLNVGCPSSKVQKGKFGAVLMKEPKLVASCINQMKKSTNIPITVKCRIGVDNMNTDKHLDHFVEEVSFAGCDTFIIHARKAWLNGLSPKDNREIPPLDYQRVYKLKDSFPNINFVINGGINSINESIKHLQYVDGVMIGREAYDNPLLLTEVDSRIFCDEKTVISRSDILRKLFPYLKEEVEQGTKISHITRHLMGLFRGFNGAKNLRKLLMSVNDQINPLENFESLLKKEMI